METEAYNIAGLNIRIKSEYSFKKSDILEKFVTDEKEQYDYEITIVLVDDLPDVPENEVYAGSDMTVYDNGTEEIRRYSFHDRYGVFACSRQVYGSKSIQICMDRSKEIVYSREGMLIEMMMLEKLLTDKGGIILHASSVAYQNKSILFSASSQTGKSTQAELWKRHCMTEILNGDRALLLKEGETWYQYGIPACGTSGISCNQKTEIGCIFLLEQGKNNKAETVKASMAFRRLYEQMTTNRWNVKNAKRNTDTLAELVQDIPVAVLICRPDIGAVEEAKRWIEENKDV